MCGDCPRAPLQNLQQRLEVYGEDVPRLESEAASFRQDTSVLEDFIATADWLHARLTTMDDDDRTEVLRLLVNRVVVGPNEVQIVLVLDVVTQTSDLANLCLSHSIQTLTVSVGV